MINLTLSWTSVGDVAFSQSYSVEVEINLSSTGMERTLTINGEVGAGVVEDTIVSEGEGAVLDSSGPGGRGQEVGLHVSIVGGLGHASLVDLLHMSMIRAEVLVQHPGEPHVGALGELHMEPDGLVLPGREPGLILSGDHSPVVVILILTLHVCRAVSFIDLDVFPGVVVNI